MLNRFYSNLFLIVLFFLTHFFSLAQCAMCRAVAENTHPEIAKAINDGIIFLMIIPYLLVLLVGYLLYRYFKKHRSNVIT